jgi:uncharacterized membrane protein YsdA (DUF1294 family)
MLPIYVRPMWWLAIVVGFGTMTAQMFVSHDQREFLFTVLTVLIALAICVTILHYKSKHGTYFPRARKK